MASRKSTLSHVNWRKVRYVVYKMSTSVHSREVGGQNWAKFGPRTYWMTHYLLALHIFHIVLYHGILYVQYNLGQIHSTWIFRMKHAKNLWEPLKYACVFLDKKVLKMILDYRSWYLIDLDALNLEAYIWLFIDEKWWKMSKWKK